MGPCDLEGDRIKPSPEILQGQEQTLGAGLG